MKKQYITPLTTVLRIVTERFIAASDPNPDELEIMDEETDVMETKDYSFNLWDDETDENGDW